MTGVQTCALPIFTHQLRDAFYIATHEAVREGEAVRFVPASPEKAGMTEFLMIKDGRVAGAEVLVEAFPGPGLLDRELLAQAHLFEDIVGQFRHLALQVAVVVPEEPPACPESVIQRRTKAFPLTGSLCPGWFLVWLKKRVCRTSSRRSNGGQLLTW